MRRERSRQREEQLSVSFFFLSYDLFIYFWLYWVSCCMGCFSSWSKWGLFSCCGVWVSHLCGFSPVAASGGSCLVAVCGFLTCVDFLPLQQVGALVQLRCVGFSLVWSTGSRARSLQQLWRVGAAVATPRLQSTGSVVVAHGVGCSAPCGIFPTQGSNLCLLRWQVDPLPPSHQGSSKCFLSVHQAKVQAHKCHYNKELYIEGL